MKSYSKKIHFCVQYLTEHGVNAAQFEMLSGRPPEDADFTIVELPRGFFYTLAEKLRELWPAGEKDGKYPWRCDVASLAKRLRLLWAERGYEATTYSVDDCLEAARKYLAQYETDAKYMQTLKYFVIKERKVLNTSTGILNKVNESVFADFLEGKINYDAQDEWAELASDDASMGQLR